MQKLVLGNFDHLAKMVNFWCNMQCVKFWSKYSQSTALILNTHSCRTLTQDWECSPQKQTTVKMSHILQLSWAEMKFITNCVSVPHFSYFQNLLGMYLSISQTLFLLLWLLSHPYILFGKSTQLRTSCWHSN